MAFGAVQVFPHAPQFAALALRSVSHPFAGFESQSPQPTSHAATPQRPSAQTPVACAGAQAAPHIPQLARLVRSEVSHPLVAVMSQSAKPALQLATAHADEAHRAVALAREHAFPHAPQFMGEEVTSVSQPDPATQSAMPVGHAAI